MEKEMAKLQMKFSCQASFDSCIAVPIEILDDYYKVSNYIEDHIDEVPVTTLEYINGTIDTNSFDVYDAIDNYLKLHNTNLVVLKKKFPNVELNSAGIPIGICPHNLGLESLKSKGKCSKKSCLRCWRIIVPESEENDEY